jgi:nucleotide-binding universal stress UspA family protein
MIRSLLVALDSSAYARAAQDHAVELGRACEARLVGVSVLDVRYLEMPPYLDYSYTFEAVPPAVVPLDLMDKFKAKSEHILADFRQVVEAAGVQADTRAEEGVPGQVISDLGDAYDLIVMGKRGEHARWGRDLLGSTAEAVARRSGTAVLLVEEQARPMRKALVLFDGSHPASRAVKLVADVASKTGMALQVLTVDDDADKGNATIAEARGYLAPLDLTVTYSVVPGRVAKAAPAVLAEHPADVVILGMRGHSPLRHLILGRTAEQLMRLIELPVLLVP